MTARVIKGTVKQMSPGPDRMITVTCEVILHPVNAEGRLPLHGILSTSFMEQTSANVYKVMLEKEAVK